MSTNHLPVLLDEVVRGLDVRRGGVFADFTLDGGGHARAILDASAPDGRVIGLDMDATMIERTKHSLAAYGDRLQTLHANFARAAEAVRAVWTGPLDGALADLGFSSLQVDDEARGFSFQKDGPLDMRLDSSAPRTAADLVADLDESELARLIADYGEEPFARRIARSIVERREKRAIRTTRELADLVAAAIPRRAHPSRIHPATRTFQALRIATNAELDSLEAMLPQALELLKPGGRLAVIAYHSLEDRIVRHTFKRWANPCVCPPDLPVCACGKTPLVRILTKKPLLPDAAEIARNPRARSAKLRLAERTAA
ncbi:MAG: 16S rRNA (cytosine(1402)-N(4))-methyltransferase RsmH [Myxococcales bacterium]|nr:MAG: 16S rRNA (cytosine(1402)-N(4))-methyltransferase RsmH [Myxococcales bacterium]